jgi:hypothetical protein
MPAVAMMDCSWLQMASPETLVRCRGLYPVHLVVTPLMYIADTSDARIDSEQSFKVSKVPSIIGTT